MTLYPLIEKCPELLKSKTGVKIEDLTMEEVTRGDIEIKDFTISKDTLMLQAKVALEEGRKQLAENLVRSAELIDIPDERILEIYNMLRPYRATQQQLMQIISELKDTYNAPICAAYIEETLEVYKKRDLLLNK